MKNSDLPDGSKMLKVLGLKLSIDECAEVAKKRKFNTDQFTTLVIHNGHNEAAFDKWLDSRMQEVTKAPLVAPKVADTPVRDPNSLARYDLLETGKGYAGKIKIIDDRELEDASK